MPAVRLALQPAGHCVQGAQDVVRLALEVRRMLAQRPVALRLLARLHVAVAVAVAVAVVVVTAESLFPVLQPVGHAAQAFRVALWAALLQVVVFVAGRLGVAPLFEVEPLQEPELVLRAYRAEHCCHAAQAFRVNPLDWLQLLSVVIARWAGLRLVSGLPL